MNVCIEGRLMPALAACALALATDVGAQAWPAKPIRMIVPFAAGGGTDIQARLFSAKLHPALGQTVIVDNRPGGGGNIGAELVAKAPPDGYAVLFQSASLAVNQTLYRKLNYNAVRDLAPVMLVSSTPLVLVVHPSVPAKNVKELIALAKAKPDRFNFGSNSTGTTSHLAAELLKTMMKVLKDPEVRSLMEKDGSEPLGSTPEEFGAYFKREVEKYAKVIKAAGAQVD